MRHQVRTKFDPTRDFTARRRMTVSGVPCEPGELFDKTLLTPRRLRVFFETRRLVYMDAPVGGARMTEEEASTTRRGAHAVRASENAKRHAAHFAKKEREDAKKRAEEAAKAPPPRKRNSPRKIEGLKADAPATAPAPKTKAPKPAKAAKPVKKTLTAEGAAFRDKMAAARAAKKSGVPAVVQSGETAAPAEPKTLKPLKRAETVTDTAAIDAARAAVTIPDGWETLEWNALSSLAAQLSDDPIKSKVQALQVIAKEIDRRGNA